MPQCAVCDEALQPEQKTCHVCGSTVDASVSATPVGTSYPPALTSLPPIPIASPNNSNVCANDPFPPALPAPTDNDHAASSNIERQCPTCGLTFGASHHDEFCSCGTELQVRAEFSSAPSATTANVGLAAPQLPPVVLPEPVPVALLGSSRPPIGTVCLVVYSDMKPRQPVRYFPLAKDVVVLGREDAVRGDFPDLDLASLVDESLARKVSRRHAEVLRARDSQTFSLRPLPGNTGTQVGKELATPGQNYPLTDGTPIVLGGVIWLKFETIR